LYDGWKFFNAIVILVVFYILYGYLYLSLINDQKVDKEDGEMGGTDKMKFDIEILENESRVKVAEQRSFHFQKNNSYFYISFFVPFLYFVIFFSWNAHLTRHQFLPSLFSTHVTD
jgi:hypothetical protein